MYFTIMSRGLAENKETHITVPYIVISISSHGERSANIPVSNSCLDILHIKFDDVSSKEEIEFNHCTIAISDEDARNILEFVERYKKDVNDMIIHCEAGISRSPGVGLALNQIFNGKGSERKYIISEFGLNNANLFVRDTVLNIYK